MEILKVLLQSNHDVGFIKYLYAALVVPAVGTDEKKITKNKDG